MAVNNLVWKPLPGAAGPYTSKGGEFISTAVGIKEVKAFQHGLYHQTFHGRMFWMILFGLLVTQSKLYFYAYMNTFYPEKNTLLKSIHNKIKGCHSSNHIFFL